VVCKQRLRKLATPPGQSARVVGQERIVYQLRDRLTPRDRVRIYTLAAQEVFACSHGTSASRWASAATPWVRRSRAWRTVATASRGLSVTVKSWRSVVAIFPSPATRYCTHSNMLFQYYAPN